MSICAVFQQEILLSGPIVTRFHQHPESEQILEDLRALVLSNSLIWRQRNCYNVLAQMTPCLELLWFMFYSWLDPCTLIYLYGHWYSFWSAPMAIGIHFDLPLWTLIWPYGPWSTPMDLDLSLWSLIYPLSYLPLWTLVYPFGHWSTPWSTPRDFDLPLSTLIYPYGPWSTPMDLNIPLWTLINPYEGVLRHLIEPKSVPSGEESLYTSSSTRPLAVPALIPNFGSILGCIYMGTWHTLCWYQT